MIDLPAIEARIQATEALPGDGTVDWKSMLSDLRALVDQVKQDAVEKAALGGRVQALEEAVRPLGACVDIYLTDAEQGCTGTLDLRSLEKQMRDALTFMQATLHPTEPR